MYKSLIYISLILFVLGFEATEIPKDKMQRDFLHGGEKKNYYLEVQKEESGFIILNFLRGYGVIHTSIISKESALPDDEDSWKDMLLHSEIENKVPYNTKKASICEDGCYLLITVESSLAENNSEQYQFTLIVNDKTNVDSSIVFIPTEEYIMGDILLSKDETVQDYFEVILLSDSEKVVIDLQSEAASLFINVGEGRKPTKSRCDIQLETRGEDTIFEISRDTIIKFAEKNVEQYSKEEGLFHVPLIIGVWTNVTDSVFNTKYSFKVHLPPKKAGFDINIVNTDQKVLCQAEKKSTDKYPYNCIYLIPYLSEESKKNLLIYPIIRVPDALYQMHASLISKKDYESDSTTLQMPSSASTFSTTKTKLDYISLPEGMGGQYLLVNVATNKPTIVELLSTFYTNEEKIKPHPSSEQLLVVQKEKLSLDFRLTDDYIVNLNSIAGVGEIYWETNPENKYYLRDRNDQLSITKNKDYKDTLIILNLYPQEKKDDQTVGFAFHISYTYRALVNFDHVTFGKTVNFVYSDTNFPISIYSRLDSKDKDINIFFSLNQLIDSNNKYINLFEENYPYIYATIIKEKTIYDTKYNSDLTPDLRKAILGKYDPSIKTGYVLLDKDYLASTDIKDYERPNLYLLISKSDFGPVNILKKMDLEITINQPNSDISTSEKIYQYGKLSGTGTKMNCYRLETDKVRKYMRIEFSANSGFINFAISKSSNSNRNDTFKEMKTEYFNGRSLITFNSEPEENEAIYLNIFPKDLKEIDMWLTNYVFKYINSDTLDKIKDYRIIDSKITMEIKMNEDQSVDGPSYYSYKIKINEVPNSSSMHVTYIVKMISEENMLENESYQSIALSESECLVKEFADPKVQEGKVTLEVNNLHMEYKYIQVIAHITDKSINEYLSYQTLVQKIDKKKTTNEEGKTALIIFICVTIVFLIIIAVLAYFVLKFKSKNKDLRKQVDKISFEQERKEGENEGDTNLLYNSEEGKGI